jgi:hypothetical protein
MVTVDFVKLSVCDIEVLVRFPDMDSFGSLIVFVCLLREDLCIYVCSLDVYTVVVIA